MTVEIADAGFGGAVPVSPAVETAPPASVGGAGPATPRGPKRLREGRRVSVVPAQDGAAGRWAGTVVDHVAGAIRLRVDAEAASVMTEGTRWLVELGRPGDARYRLHGRVVDHHSADAGDGPTVRLAVHDAERIQDRSEPRAPFAGSVGVAVREHDWYRIGTIRFRDLSGSGVAADCSVPLAEGDELVGRLRLPTFPAPLGFRARVVRVTPASDAAESGYVCSFGARLVDPSPTLQRLLRRYVAASQPAPVDV